MERILSEQIRVLSNKNGEGCSKVSFQEFNKEKEDLDIEFMEFINSRK